MWPFPGTSTTLSAGQQSALLQGPGELGSVSPWASCCQNPLAARWQTLSTTCTFTLTSFSGVTEAATGRSAYGRNLQRRWLFWSRSAAWHLSTRCRAVTGQILQVKTRAGPITLDGWIPHKSVNKSEFWRANLHFSTWHHHILTHSCLFLVLHTLIFTATTTHTTNVPFSMVRKLICRTSRDRQKFLLLPIIFTIIILLQVGLL